MVINSIKSVYFTVPTPMKGLANLGGRDSIYLVLIQLMCFILWSILKVIYRRNGLGVITSCLVKMITTISVDMLSL